MTTKIFVSQIDKTNADGSQAPNGSIIAIGANGAYWANSSAISASLSTSENTSANYTWTGNHVFSSSLLANAGLLVNGNETVTRNIYVWGNVVSNSSISSVGNITTSNIVYADGAQFGNSGIVVSNGNIYANSSIIYTQYLEVINDTLLLGNVGLGPNTYLTANFTQGSNGQVLTTAANGVTIWSDISLWQMNGLNANGAPANVGSFIVMSASGRPIWTDDLAYVPVGYLGSIGYSGSIGYKGSVGDAGPGYQGSAGNQGSVGYVGSVGAGGPGYIGSAGFNGSVGFNGSSGDAGPGYAGSVGYTGSVGFNGYQGSVGYMGSVPSIGLTNLIDFPASYSGKSGNFLIVNAAATGIVFDSNTYITNTMITDINFGYNKILNPIMHGYGEDVITLGTVTTASPISFSPMSGGNIASVVLGDSVVGITIDNTGMISGKFYGIQLFITQDGTGSRTIDWSGLSVKWPSAENVPATGPVLSTTAGYTDVITLYTLNAGATYYGVLSLKGFTP